jgi:hypothetical protein
MFSYNQGRNEITIVKAPGQDRYVLIAWQISTGIGMDVSEPIPYETALARAKSWAGIREPGPSPDDVEQWLSERLGF